MTELFSVELEANNPEMVEVAIVEVAMVDEVMTLAPVKVVLPPWRVKILPLPFKVICEIVEVEIVDDVMLLVPIKAVLPLCKVKMLLFKFSAPVPLEIVLPLNVLAISAPDKVKDVPEAVVKVVWPLTFKAPLTIWLPVVVALPAVKAASVAEPVTKALPATVRSWLGVLVPRPKRWLVTS